MSPWSLIPWFFAIALAVPAAWALGRAYFHSRGRHEITCPEANDFAAIHLDARHAVAMHTPGETGRRVTACSLWPEHEGCRTRYVM